MKLDQASQEILIRLAVLFAQVLGAFPFSASSHDALRGARHKYVNTSYQTNWGTLTQIGKQVGIAGHPVWAADGSFRPDGKLYIKWYELGNDNMAHGLYEWQNGHFAGKWGWEPRSHIDDRGEMSGEVSSDVIRKVIEMPAGVGKIVP